MSKYIETLKKKYLGEVVDDWNDLPEDMVGLLEYVDLLEKIESRWISVKDKLPKIGLDVLSCIEGEKYSVEIGWIDKENIWSVVRENISPVTRKPPTHWATLPKAKGT